MMPNMFCGNGNGLHAHFTLVFIFSFMFLLTFFNFGRAAVIVYDGDIDIDEFPDVELPYAPLAAHRKHGIEGPVVAATPIHACVNISKPPDQNVSMDWIVLISGNACRLETKVLNAKSAGYSVALIYTYRGRVENPSLSHNGHYHFYPNISAVVIKTEHGLRIKENYLYTIDERFRLYIFSTYINSISITTLLLLFSIVAGLFLVVMLAFAIIRYFQLSQSVRNCTLSSRGLRRLQTSTFQKGDRYETCAICLEDYKDRDRLRILPCSHGYHAKCIDPWLTNNRPICPVCKQKVVVLRRQSPDNSVDPFSVERSETTPLLQAQQVNQHGTYTGAASSDGEHDRQNVPSFRQL